MHAYRTVAEAVANVGTTVPDAGFVFQDMKGIETSYTFTEVEQLTATRAAGLQALGLVKGDRVGLVVIEPEDFVLTFLAALRMGLIPVPMYPPLSFGSLDAYADRSARILELSKAKLLVASKQLKHVLWGLVDRVSSLQRLEVVEDLASAKGTPDFPEVTPEDVAFLQYTSGSTSDPKGVVVTHGNLAVNSRCIILDGLKLENGRDKGVSWLPLYHDMGLIGFVIAPLMHGIPVVFIPTMRFIKRPQVWLDAVHRHRGTITFAPNFAYALATRRIRDRDADGWDLSCMRACGCGAEPIQPDTIRAFTDRFSKQSGLPVDSVLPAYGMAEATLAISFKPVNGAMRTRHVASEAFQATGAVQEPEDDTVALEHVSCGPPFPDHEVSVRDAGGRDLGEAQEGELCVRGPSVAGSYFENPEASASTFRDGWLYTGDLGYVLDGEVYVTGRIKDLIILNGRNVHPQAVEWEVATVEGVRKGNVVAFSRPSASSEELVVVLETKLTEHEALKEAVSAQVRKELGFAVADVVCLEPGTLPKTSSGKLQRRKTRQQYLAGSLGTDGTRTFGATGNTVTVAKHVARSLWSRAKAANPLR